MSLHDDALEDAEVVRSGEFKLDRARAMEKLARFQLLDPHRYVLELVAAAVRAGATGISIDNDADDFEIEWDGRHPTPEEIDALFDHIFRQGSDDEARMLQHLAQGLHGALGLNPRWVRLERPGLQLDLTDPLDVQRTASPRTAGVRVHVRERFSLAVMAEWLTATSEVRTLNQDAAWCPVPIEINGRSLRRRLVGAPPNRTTRQVDGSEVWLDETGPVHVIRDGIRVTEVHLGFGELALTGSVRADDVKLNASRSEVVKDNAWRTLSRRLHAAFRDLLIDGLQAEVAPWPVAVLRQAAVELITQRTKETRALQALPIWVDANERAWSAAQLKAAGQVLTFTAPGRMARELDKPQLFLTQPPSAAQTRIRALLVVLSVETRDADGLLEDLLQGRLRRADLARKSHPLDHSRALRQRAFERDGVRGVAAFGSSVLPAGEYGCRVELRVDGLPVEATALQLPGPISIRLDADLDAGPRFRRVVRNAAYEHALEIAADEAAALMADLARDCDRIPVAQQALLLWLRRDTRDRGKRLPPELQQAEVFPLHGSGHVSLATLRDWVSQHGELRTCRSTLVLPFPTEGLLSDDAASRRTMRELFGNVLRDVSQELEDRVVRERRLAAAAESARIAEYTIARVGVDTAGMRGEVGLLVEGGDPGGTSVRVLHQGVFLGELVAPTGFPSTRAVVDVEHIAASPRLDALADAERSAKRIAEVLKPALRTLVLETAAPPESDAVIQAWLEGALRSWRPLPRALQELPLFPTVSGRSESIASLAVLPPGPVEYLPTAPDSAPPDMQGVLILDPSRRRVVAAQRFGKRGERALRDVTRRLEIRSQALKKFEARAPQPLFPTGLVVAVRHVTASGLRVSVGLSTDPDREPGLRARVLFRERFLVALNRAFPIAADAVVHGDAIAPDSLYQNLSSDPKAVHAALDRAANEALDTWLDFPALPPLARLRLLDHLLRVAAPTPAQTRAADRLRAFPLLATLDGGLAKVTDLGDEVVLVPPDVTPRETPDGRVWLRSGRDVRRLVQVLGLQKVEGRALLETIESGERRRQELDREALFPRTGAWSAVWRVDRGEAQHWVGLGVSSDASTGRIEWLVDDRVLAVEALKVGVPVVLRIADPAIEPNLAFSAPQPGAALEAARARARELADAFLLGCARFSHGDPAVTEGQFTRLLSDRLLPTLVRYAAGRDLPSAWDALALLETSTGERLPLRALTEAASRGRIPLVPDGTYGRPADPTRQVFRADPTLTQAIRTHGPTQDVTLELRKHEEAWRRREAPPVQVPATTRPTTVLSLDVDPPREGFLQVDAQGQTEVVLHAGWRRLGRIAHKGPVPLMGHVSDAAIEPDETWSEPTKGDALTALETWLEERSTHALERMLNEVPLSRTRLWLGVLQRMFKHRRDIPRPGGPGLASRVAGLELFRTGGGRALTPHELVQLRRPPRWVTPAVATPSSDPKRPYVVVDASVLDMAIAFFGGAHAKDEALEDFRANRRRGRMRRAFTLPDGRYWAERTVEGKGFRALLALETELELPGRLHYRVDGVPLETREVDLPGLLGVVEVDRADKAFTQAAPDKGRERTLERTYAHLVRAGAGGIRESWFGRRRVRDILALGTTIRAPWLDAQLLTAPGGAITLQQALDADRVLLGRSPHPSHPVVHDEGANRDLLAAVGIQPVDAATWTARQAAEAERRKEQARAKAEGAARTRTVEAVRAALQTLVKGLSVPRKVAQGIDLDQAPKALRTRALEGDASAHILCAWYLGERALVASGRTKLLPELALRVGEQLAGARR